MLLSAGAVRADARKKAVGDSIGQARGNVWFRPGPEKKHKIHTRKGNNKDTEN